MIVQCPSCSTKYNLPDDKAKEGAKVRCSVCKHVFPLIGPADLEAPAEPPVPEPEPQPEPEPEAQIPPTDEEVFSQSFNDEEEIDFGDFGDLGIEGLDDLDETSVASEPGGAVDFGDLAGEGEDTIDFGDLAGEEEEPGETIDFGDLEGEEEEGTEAPTEFGPAEVDMEEGEDSFEDIFGKKEVPEDLAVELDGGEGEEPASEIEEAAAAAEAADSRIGVDEDLFDIDAQNEKRAKESLTKKKVKKKVKKEKPGKEKKKSNPIASVIVFAVLLLFAGGVIAYLYAPDLLKSIPFIGSLVETPGAPAPAQPKAPKPAAGQKPASEAPAPVADIKDLALKDIQQNYVENEKVGELFVVQGSVVNNFKTPKELIRIEASLFDANGLPVVTKKQLIGNTLTLFQLQMLTIEEIDKELQDKVGIVTSNTNIPSGGEVPFVVVFANPPQNVAEFGVKIIEAKDPPADKAQ